MQFESWTAFCLIALLATATPGAAAMLVSIHSLSFGFKKTLATIFGNVTGLFIMSLLSVIGLSSVVVNSAVVFNVIKMGGALYLIFIGVKLWRNGLQTTEISNANSTKRSTFSMYTQGVFIALTNPKAILFTAALFPQFIVFSEPLLHQFFVLAVSFMTLSFICLCTYSFLAYRTKSISKNVYWGKWQGRIFGIAFISAGGILANSSR